MRLRAWGIRFAGLLRPLRSGVAARFVRALCESAGGSAPMDARAGSLFVVPPSGLLLPRALRTLSLTSAHRSVGARARSWLWPAHAGRGHGQTPPARFSGRACGRERVE